VSIKEGDSELLADFVEQEVMDEWIQNIENNRNESSKLGFDLEKRKGSKIMRIKKNLGSKIATSSAGKSLIRDMTDPLAISVIDIIKQVIEIKEDKKRATEIENNIIKVVVKVLLLVNNKDISLSELSKTIPLIKEIWSDALDFCEISFSYNPDGFAQKVHSLKEMLTEILQVYLSDKTLNRLSESLDYLCRQELLDCLYVEGDQTELKNQLLEILRTLWNRAFFDENK